VNRVKVSVQVQESLCKSSFPWTPCSSKLSSLAFPMRADDVGLLTLRHAKIAPPALLKQ